jgi:hypothetical protein
METYLDDLREMRRQVYDLFKYKPELLTGPELSKGEQQQGSQAIYGLQKMLNCSK